MLDVEEGFRKAANAMWQYYNALINEGFNEDQALAILLKHVTFFHSPSEDDND